MRADMAGVAMMASLPTTTLDTPLPAASLRMIWRWGRPGWGAGVSGSSQAKQGSQAEAAATQALLLLGPGTRRTCTASLSSSGAFLGLPAVPPPRSPCHMLAAVGTHLHRLLVEVAAVAAQADRLALRLLAQRVEQRLDPAAVPRGWVGGWVRGPAQRGVVGAASWTSVAAPVRRRQYAGSTRSTPQPQPAGSSRQPASQPASRHPAAAASQPHPTSWPGSCRP